MSACKNGCGLEVRWVQDDTRKTKRGKPRWRCLNPDGTDHWDLCSKTRTALAKAEGRPFEHHDGEGVHWRKKDRYMHRQAKSVVGANYVPSCGECNVPPWERCACSERLAA
jgi:hypothetical protein